MNFAQLLKPSRIIFTLVASSLLGLLIASVWRAEISVLFIRMWLVSLSAMLAFGVLEQWPKNLPNWVARWVLQILAVAITIPIGFFTLYVISTEQGQPAFWLVKDRLGGFAFLNIPSLLFGPWIALIALVRQKDALARHQTLAFALERSELERQALDARFRLLQAQVEPHFLFNTLANIRALVNTSSRQAPAVLDSLIAYLQAAVPRLHHSPPSFAQEWQLARSYLEIMQMRMPDRLQFSLQIDEAMLAMYCPPMSLLTLVENAVRHGIDPSEEGGLIQVNVDLHQQHCRIQVKDTGVGLSHINANQSAHPSLGTGLLGLRERLQLDFGDKAYLKITAIEPHGVHAEVVFPVRKG
ncbi:histidine kinase [Undibacterium amnicola]|uniref:Histidine kinase n=1 Tax=Undibacterium amnicola TaxID=1834038 RepID=A0ABR6XNY0_9BURK|nr:histidine kinase [Undibacterium amnicola]MBC3831210.1 histidine kinase [Undibacterium amnicola]